MNSLGIDISRYVVQEGPVFRLRPQQNAGEIIAVDTSLTYRNLVTNADYSNLADSSVHFTYEDHFARMIVPVRHSFNDLASAFLRKGNVEMASTVMRHAVEHLYHPHLRPSYTNVEAAEILLVLNENDLAAKLSKSLYAYYYDRVKFEREENKTPSNLDLYLLKRSAELMAATAAKQDLNGD